MWSGRCKAGELIARPSVTYCTGDDYPECCSKFQNKCETYSRIWCFQYGQSCPPIGPQLSKEWRIPLLARIPEKWYVGPEFSHCPVPVDKWMSQLASCPYTHGSLRFAM